MTDTQTEVKIALLIAGQDALRRELDENKREGAAALAIVCSELAALKAERDKALKWGVMSLGSAVLGMGYWIVNKIIGGHIQ